MTGTQSPPVTAEGLLKDVIAFFDHGEFFRAYDLAAEAPELFPGNVWLAHRAVLSLANAGDVGGFGRLAALAGVGTREPDVGRLLRCCTPVEWFPLTA